MFVALGSKCDLLPVKGSLAVDSIFPGGKLIPVSSFTRHGFQQLREQFTAPELRPAESRGANFHF